MLAMRSKMVRFIEASHQWVALGLWIGCYQQHELPHAQPD